VSLHLPYMVKHKVLLDKQRSLSWTLLLVMGSWYACVLQNVECPTICYILLYVVTITSTGLCKSVSWWHGIVIHLLWVLKRHTQPEHETGINIMFFTIWHLIIYLWDIYSHRKELYFFSKLHAYRSPRNCTLTKQLRRPLTNHIELHPSSTSTIANCSWLLCVHNPCAALLDSWMSVTTPCFHPNTICFITIRHQYSPTR